MNKKFALTLLSSPVLFASMLSMLMIAHPARANQTVNSSEARLSCVRNSHSVSSRFGCAQVTRTNAITSKPEVKVQQNNDSGDIKELNFSEEESDAAIAMFGCDCPVCLNAIRQMRGLAPMRV
ncbi:hypothetical protein ACF3DV_00810 [Chlorogloeopsis fritschii PCC 9212]|uniref:HMA domain-containing protein n=1 Tax=Chlorogloeopsis fritschii PCC 6912 TaxID=211165 RepID=A0A3S1AHW5_CHLFR|nr:hypothetical protein [Chlorogloeopsis fritschii]RUR80253.1 hypothetical protein PCC6912_31130 [Chlorogloeopsis fritschii PCC 6912]